MGLERALTRLFIIYNKMPAALRYLFVHNSASLRASNIQENILKKYYSKCFT